MILVLKSGRGNNTLCVIYIVTWNPKPHRFHPGFIQVKNTKPHTGSQVSSRFHPGDSQVKTSQDQKLQHIVFSSFLVQHSWLATLLRTQSTKCRCTKLYLFWYWDRQGCPSKATFCTTCSELDNDKYYCKKLAVVQMQVPRRHKLQLCRRKQQ